MVYGQDARDWPCVRLPLIATLSDERTLVRTKRAPTAVRRLSSPIPNGVSIPIPIPIPIPNFRTPKEYRIRYCCLEAPHVLLHVHISALLARSPSGFPSSLSFGVFGTGPKGPEIVGYKSEIRRNAAYYRIRVHFCPQHWLPCHSALYQFEFEFAYTRRGSN